MSLDSPVICFKLASRSRPQKLFNCIENINSMVGYPHYFILVTLDEDDPTCTTEEFKHRIRQYGSVIPIWGRSGSKIKAINRDMEAAPPWDILVNTSDDIWYIYEGFGQIIVDHMRHYWPDFDGVLHYPDGNETGTRVMTVTIEGRPYYDRHGYIYWPGDIKFPPYESLWADVEATEKAKRDGKYQAVQVVILDHRHPAFGKAPMDPQYQYTERFFLQDHAVYVKREAAGFPPISVAA